MIQLFGNKWIKTEGNIFKVGKDGRVTDVYEDRFLIWCNKTRPLFRCHKESDPNEAAKRRFAKGMEFVEHEVMEAARLGEKKEVWPPSYAKFMGFCQIGSEEAAHKKFEPLKLPDKTAQEKAKVAGERELDKLKSLFE